ncbi:glycoside hydrolase family 172 protein [Paludisphaera rhizosphaerae]|uniref:glycoside hydrolase family 172 protein n=1 Tax=Paludisphaera rhizosphaerae TaxID=2711216 RepID=UPI0013EB7D1A|nr:glycoside hydrolase family 172 protein [Paludisphaera rhizosphaerae]
MNAPAKLPSRAARLATGLIAFLPALTALAPAAEPPRPTTVESLLARMSDPSWLAVPPAPGERSFQFSSYDRATKLVDGKIVSPFANADRGHYLRVEGEGQRKEWVLADAQGPGYVSRIWSPNPAGELRIYIDGATTPALAADFAAIASGKVEPFSAPFGQETSRGWNLYFPFPFAKSIKITTTRGDQYYQANVTTFAPGTAVESYSSAVLSRAAEAVAKARRSMLESPLAIHADAMPASQPERLDPGSPREFLVEPGGPGALTALTCQILRGGLDDAALAEVLARTLLTITFDDAAEPQVAAPLGDFFGSGPGLNPFRSLFLEVGSDATMASRWVMPFKKSARIVLTNQSGRPAQFVLRYSYRTDPGDAGRLTFHARWSQRDEVPTVKGDGTLDWPALRISGGAGRYVGLLCNVYNPTSAWWGEGDEKVYVDGEAFPSTFGTGTEDYFGYGWSDPRPFAHPFHAQTRCDGPGNKGNTSVVRFQSLDNIPFDRSLAFDLELWHWEAVKVQFATLAYLYAAPGAKVEPAPVADLSKRIVHPRPAVTREPGAIEAESLHVRSKTAGEVTTQDMSHFGDVWSGYAQLWWTVRGQEAEPKLDLELPVEKPGRFALWAGFTKAPDYAQIQPAVDGQPLGKPIDLYAPRVAHSGGVLLGVADLPAGPNVLSLSIVGQNEKSTGRLVGVDWFKLIPAPAGDYGPGRLTPRR